MVDSHIHTEFSSDSEMKLQHGIEHGTKLDIGMTITEHLDLKFPTGTDFTFDIDKYFKDYEKYKSSKLMLGIEIGMQLNCIEENREIINKYPFDYVIGSIHAADGEDIFNPKSYEGKSKSEFFEQYFSSMVDCVKKYDFIDSLGHIDYISRYATYKDNEINYLEFKEYIDEVLKALVHNGKVMEINTRRLKNVEAYKNLVQVYSAYKQIGGKYVTIGSDAHYAEDIGNNFTVASRICQVCDLKPVYFKNRKMEFI
ncbi:histidinol phosphate phosphatase [Clostridium bowmanii]|uniref:histidinol phosphate phosphatase n=1 Tax=Clostridium bowmanii TaxID=132925 RepID=UPI001C0DA7D4|nr:histidinol phosphate phosphatase [Clostridium bowmanii]MBU3191246.1 histidinol phosphate phosphatase [Clostridium bowmanii]MCA1075695.1 histidinol phosphate phosphatase [Clostridium bowmanii]